MNYAMRVTRNQKCSAYNKFVALVTKKHRFVAIGMLSIITYEFQRDVPTGLTYEFQRDVPTG